MNKTVFIHSISSDIGLNLALRYAEDGYHIAGTYRSTQLLSSFSHLDNCQLNYCDLSDNHSIKASAEEFAKSGLQWNTYISCASTCNPLQAFFEADFDEWLNGVHINAIAHLRYLHALFSLRDTSFISNVIFFTGPGTNNAPKNFSSAVIAKIMLLKMCELLQAENPDLNLFIVGPGWTKTKTHKEILASPHISDEKYKETMDFLINREGTSMDDIYLCIRWLEEQGPEIVGGRNFSVVHDCWGSIDLRNELLNNPDMYKLRRCANDWGERSELQHQAEESLA